MKGYTKMSPHKYRWLKRAIVSTALLLSVEGVFSVSSRYSISCPMIITGAILALLVGILVFKRDKIRMSVEMEWLIRNRNLHISHLESNGKEVIDYYPNVWYRKVPDENAFYLRFRLDGTEKGEELRELAQPLADAFETVCNNSLLERGYITYEMEMDPQEQIQIGGKRL